MDCLTILFPVFMKNHKMPIKNLYLTSAAQVILKDVKGS